MRILIKNGFVINPASEGGRLNILIEDDKITKIAPLTPKNESIDKVIDATDCFVAPGLVDTHVHFRDPGQTHKEDILTGAEAAKRGGYTTVVMMANTTPPIDNAATLKYVLEKGAKTGIHVKACATVTVGMKGEELTNMEALKKAGAIGFTDDGKPITNFGLLTKAISMSKYLKVPISLHEEDPRLIQTPGYNYSVRVSDGLGLKGADRAAEYEMIERDVQIMHYTHMTHASMNIQHVSTAEGVNIIRRYKQHPYGELHAEATPHHFTLTELDAIELGTMAKMNPPLRTEHDRQAIIEGLRDGTIDLIATDHAPHTAEEKGQGLAKAPSGVIGLETALGLAITELSRYGVLGSDGIPIQQIIECMSYNPARMYHLDAGVLREDGPADIVIFNPNEKWIVNENDFASKSKNSPFIGRELTGKVKFTICDGKIVYADRQP